jgi:ankyrin repeat protein
MYSKKIDDITSKYQKEDDMFNVLTYAATGEIDKSTKHVKPEHSEIIRYLVQEKGIPVDTRSGAYEGYPNSGVTPLMVACVFKHFAAVQTLCELGADVNARAQNGFTPISATCNFDNDDDEELSEELKSRIKFDDTSKHIIDYLLTQGANINDVDDRGTTCLMRLASIKGNSDGLLFLLSPSFKVDPTMLDSSENSALAYACDSGDAEHINIMANLVDPNEERNVRNMTLLMRMASGDYSKWSSSLKALLDLKDGAGNMLIELEARNTQGLTALHLAAINGNTEAVRDLCDAGANVNACDKDGNTTLIILITNVQWVKTPSKNVKEVLG